MTWKKRNLRCERQTEPKVRLAMLSGGCSYWCRLSGLPVTMSRRTGAAICLDACCGSSPMEMAGSRASSAPWNGVIAPVFGSESDVTADATSTDRPFQHHEMASQGGRIRALVE